MALSGSTGILFSGIALAGLATLTILLWPGRQAAMPTAAQLSAGQAAANADKTANTKAEKLGESDGNVPSLPEATSRLTMPAFPGAQGYGATTPGGRGGRILTVTNLRDNGPGSLRNAISTPGPRTIVFRVSGVIRLRSRIVIREPFVTVAGQTAPGQGVILVAAEGGGQMIHVNTHDVILRYLRIRTGALGKPGAGQVNIQVNSGAHDVMIDHCSLSWALDENLDITRNIPDDADAETWPEIYNVTVQRSIMAEGLLPHSTGTRVGGEFERDGWKGVHHIAIHHNLYYANNSRNPMVASTGLKVVNNYVFQWGSELGATTAGSIVDWIANYFRPGNLSATQGHLVHNAFEKRRPHIIYPAPIAIHDRQPNDSEYKGLGAIQHSLLGRYDPSFISSSRAAFVGPNPY